MVFGVAVPLTAKSQGVNAKHIKPEAKGVADLVEKMRADEQFLFGISIIRYFCSTLSVSIDTENEDPRINELRENLENVWYKKQKPILDAIEYGRVAFEKVYFWDTLNRIYILDELNELEYSQSKLELKDGQFAGVKYGHDVFYNPQECWWLAVNTTATNPHGKSIYLGAPYAVWKVRRQFDRNFDIWFKRFAVGRGVAYAPTSLPGPVTETGSKGEVSQDGMARNPLAEVAKALQSLEAGGDLMLPSERDPRNGQRYYDYVPGQDLKDGAPLQTAQQILDNKALRSLIIPDRAVTQDAATGARAVADTHLSVFYSIIEGTMAEIIESFQSNIIEPACEVNGFDCDCIQINYQPLGDEAKSLIKQIIQTILVGSAINPIVANGVIDIPAMLKTAGIPLGPDVDAAMAAVKAAAVPPAPVAGPPSFGGGFPKSLSLTEEIAAGRRRTRQLLKEFEDAATVGQ